jgi:hypothetical protein
MRPKTNPYILLSIVSAMIYSLHNVYIDQSISDAEVSQSLAATVTPRAAVCVLCSVKRGAFSLGQYDSMQIQL